MRTQKDKLRKIRRNKRLSLSETEQQQKSQQIIKHILTSDIFKRAKKIGYYYAVRGEADPQQLYSDNTNKQFYLPIISDTQSIALEFAPVNSETKFKNNQFSIPEPIVENKQLINAKELDLLIMPLLGFDKNGNRLGMGGGFYDRSLAFKQQSQANKPILLGFAYDFQAIDKLEVEPWDIPLDAIATESGLLIL